MIKALSSKLDSLMYMDIDIDISSPPNSTSPTFPFFFSFFFFVNDENRDVYSSPNQLHLWHHRCI